MDRKIRFIANISRLRRWFVTQIVTRILLYTVILSLLFAIAAVILAQFRLISLSGYAAYFYLVLIALGISGLLSAYKLTRFGEELIELDRRLGLHEQLSTAYEYSKSQRNTEIGSLLLEDAGRLLESLDRKRIYPHHFSWKHAIIPVLAVVLIVLLRVDLLPLFSEHSPVTRGRLHQLGEELEALSEQKSDSTASEQEPQEKIAKKTKELAESLQKGKKEQQDLITDMETLLENARAERKQLTDLLESELMDRPISDLPVVNPTEKAEELTAEQLSQLMEQIENMMEQIEQQGTSGQGTVPQKLASMNQNLQLEQFLMESLDEMNDDGGTGAASQSQEQEMTAQSQGTGQGEDGEEGANDQEPSSSEQQQGSFSENLTKPGTEEELPSDTQMMLEELAKMMGKPPEGQSGQGHPDGSEEEQLAQGGGLPAPPDDEKQGTGGSDLNGDGNSEDKFSSIAGKQQGDYNPQEAVDDLRSSQGAAIQDRTGESPTEDFRKIVRSLATIGRSDVEAEDVMVSFEHEVEEILHKEDIPAIYRDYIKNYFISIGVRTE